MAPAEAEWFDQANLSIIDHWYKESNWVFVIISHNVTVADRIVDCADWQRLQISEWKLTIFLYDDHLNKVEKYLEQSKNWAGDTFDKQCEWLFRGLSHMCFKFYCSGDFDTPLCSWQYLLQQWEIVLMPILELQYDIISCASFSSLLTSSRHVGDMRAENEEES